MILLATLSGCTTPKGKGPTTGGDSLPPQPFVGSPSPDKEAAGSLARRPMGMLAGAVIDPARYRVPNAKIQVTALEGGKSSVTVTTDRNGYFDVPGLEKGRRYQLTATSRRGDVVWTGTAVATASDVRINIQLTESRAAEASPASARSEETTELPPPISTGPAADRMAGDGARGDFDLPPPSSPAAIPGPGRDGDEAPSRKPSMPPPPVREEGVTTPLAGASPRAPAPPAPRKRPGTGPATVPSCVRPGNTVHNFALYDFHGKSWELAERQTGKLVLLDFWKLDCPPCLAALPELIQLQESWGRHGLQVVSILHDTSNVERRRERVLAVAADRRTRYNFPVLFSEDRCPVREKMEVFVYPTLILLDENGRILRKWEGLDEANRRELVALLRSHLEK
jgi:thiol-disulfide isomerase/thioredoxin